jgi:hypothetical protein
MQKLRKVFFPKPDTKIFHGFGPAFLAIALAIGSGEFILWPYLSAHHGFGILWGAMLGISIQLIIIVAVERHTAFLGEDALSSFTRVFKKAFWWIVFSTLIGFGWPGFSAMSAQLLSDGLSLSISQNYLSFIILILASGILLIGKNSYKKIIFLQKINMTVLLLLTFFLFIYYFDIHTFTNMIKGFVGAGENYIFVPAGLSMVTFMGAIAYAGSGGNLLLMNSFYVEKENKGLVAIREEKEFLVPDDSKESIENTKLFTKASWKQNGLFFWGGGVLIILLLSYISYAVLHNVHNLAEDFSFLVTEAHIFSKDIHPIIGAVFIITGSLALFGVQLGIFDFMGRLAGNRPDIIDGSKKQNTFYKSAVAMMAVFGLVILALGISKPNTLIIIGSTINAFSMGVIAWLLYRVEKKILPKYIQSKFFKASLFLSAVFYVGFFLYVIFDKFL